MRKQPITSGVYLIVNEQKKRVYVGCSKNVGRRWVEHQRKLNASALAHGNTDLYDDWQECGPDAFSFEVVHESSSIYELAWFEERLVESLRSSGINLYNSRFHRRYRHRVKRAG